jgi:hypothetical protein
MESMSHSFAVVRRRSEKQNSTDGSRGEKNRKVVKMMTVRTDHLTMVGQQKQSEKGYFMYEC